MPSLQSNPAPLLAIKERCCGRRSALTKRTLVVSWSVRLNVGSPWSHPYKPNFLSQPYDHSKLRGTHSVWTQAGGERPACIPKPVVTPHGKQQAAGGGGAHLSTRVHMVMPRTS